MKNKWYKRVKQNLNSLQFSPFPKDISCMKNTVVYGKRFFFLNSSILDK